MMHHLCGPLLLQRSHKLNQNRLLPRMGTSTVPRMASVWCIAVTAVAPDYVLMAGRSTNVLIAQAPAFAFTKPKNLDAKYVRNTRRKDAETAFAITAGKGGGVLYAPRNRCLGVASTS